MAGKEAISLELHRRIVRQLNSAMKLQMLGFVAAGILLFVGLACIFALSMVDTSNFSLPNATTLNNVFIEWLFLITAVPLIGTLIGVPLSRWKLRRVCVKLARHTVSPHLVMRHIQQTADKDVSYAATECLRMLPKLEPAETLVRASSVPAQISAATLLRPTIEAMETEPQQLLRATSSSSERGE